MRRRLLAPALLMVAVLAIPVPALADPAGDVTGGTDAVGAVADGSLVVAAEGEPTGPRPQPRLRADNPAGELYADRDVPFTWGAAWLLTGLGLLGLAAMFVTYLLRVRRPIRQQESAGRR